MGEKRRDHSYASLVRGEQCFLKHLGLIQYLTRHYFHSVTAENANQGSKKNTMDDIAVDSSEDHTNPTDNDIALMLHSCGICGCIYKDEDELDEHLELHLTGTERNKYNNLDSHEEATDDLLTVVIPVFFMVKQIDSSLNEHDAVTEVSKIDEQETKGLEQLVTTSLKEEPEEHSDSNEANLQLGCHDLDRAVSAKTRVMHNKNLCQQKNQNKSRAKRGKNGSNPPKFRLKVGKGPMFKCHPCISCGKIYTKKALLNLHKKIHAQEKANLCYAGVDKATFSTYRAKESHTGTRHVVPKSKPEVNTQEKVLCELCGKEFKHVKTLRDHKASVHATSSKFLCNECGKAFRVKSLLRSHQRVHSDNRPFVCEVCGRAFKTKTHLVTHLRVHSDARPFVCDVCGQGFKLKSILKGHMSRHTGIKPFVCELCGKGFATSSCRRVHMKVHDVGMPAGPLRKRGRKCLDKPNLGFEIDEVLHNGKCLFQCRFCGKSLNSLTAAKRHQLELHITTEKNFKCNHCEKSFRTKLLLKRHADSHNGGKDYKCPHCDKSFKTRNNLYMHKYIHQGRRWLCKLCQKLLSPAEAGKHFKVKHKEELKGTLHWSDLCELYLADGTPSFKETTVCDNNFQGSQDIVENTVERLLTPDGPCLNVLEINVQGIEYLDIDKN